MTALSGTHFTAYVPAALVPPVRVGCQEVDTSVLNSFPDSQRFCSRALFVRRRVGGFVALWDRCPRSRSFFGLFLVSGFSSGVDSNRALSVRREPMVPFVLVTGIRVVASYGRVEECPR